MKKSNILITGGAGFIGSFLTDRLIDSGYNVRILDSLEDQVHQGKKPKYLNKKAEFIKGDILDYKKFEASLKGIDIVFHLAASVGVGQSNYEIKRYTDTNIGGMANLLDIVANNRSKVKKIIMTASMTGYGEGYGKCKEHGKVKPALRSEQQLSKKNWSLYCPICKKKLISVPTDEKAYINNNSIYSLTKNVQETMLMLIGEMYHIPVTSFRCFNVYGPRQSLSNPYTGVTAIFVSRLKNNHQPILYEDGMQSRDFISVHDVVAALVMAIDNKKSDFEIFNLGSGHKTPIKDIAEILAKLLGKKISPKTTGKFRVNDIRHCYADITKVGKLLGWEPSVKLENGLKELIEWSRNEEARDMFDNAEKKMKEKNLL